MSLGSCYPALYAPAQPVREYMRCRWHVGALYTPAQPLPKRLPEAIKPAEFSGFHSVTVVVK